MQRLKALFSGDEKKGGDGNAADSQHIGAIKVEKVKRLLVIDSGKKANNWYEEVRTNADAAVYSLNRS